jgi:hypothetical protein
MNEDYSLNGLTRFLELLESKGLANKNTVKAIRGSVTRILGDEDTADVREIDVPGAVRRYNNKNPNLLSPSSLAEYQRRVALAIKEFETYTESPTSYTGFGRETSATKGDEDERPKARRKAAQPDDEGAGEDGVQPSTPHLSLVYPIRPEFLAKVVVPRDMKLEEARRLAAFLATLAVDYRAE